MTNYNQFLKKTVWIPRMMTTCWTADCVTAKLYSDVMTNCHYLDDPPLMIRPSKAKLRAVYICTDGADCCTVMCFWLLYCRCHLRCIRMLKYFRTKIEIIIIIKPVRADINILWAKTTVYTRRMIGSTHEYLLITSLLFRLVIVVKS